MLQFNVVSLFCNHYHCADVSWFRLAPQTAVYPKERQTNKEIPTAKINWRTKACFNKRPTKFNHISVVNNLRSEGRWALCNTRNEFWRFSCKRRIVFRSIIVLGSRSSLSLSSTHLSVSTSSLVCFSVQVWIVIMNKTLTLGLQSLH